MPPRPAAGILQDWKVKDGGLLISPLHTNSNVMFSLSLPRDPGNATAVSQVAVVVMVWSISCCLTLSSLRLVTVSSVSVQGVSLFSFTFSSLLEWDRDSLSLSLSLFSLSHRGRFLLTKWREGEGREVGVRDCES